MYIICNYVHIYICKTIICCFIESNKEHSIRNSRGMRRSVRREEWKRRGDKKDWKKVRREILTKYCTAQSLLPNGKMQERRFRKLRTPVPTGREKIENSSRKTRIRSGDDGKWRKREETTLLKKEESAVETIPLDNSWT